MLPPPPRPRPQLTGQPPQERITRPRKSEHLWGIHYAAGNFHALCHLIVPAALGEGMVIVPTLWMRKLERRAVTLLAQVPTFRIGRSRNEFPVPLPPSTEPMARVSQS